MIRQRKVKGGKFQRMGKLSLFDRSYPLYEIYHYVNRGATCYYDISRRPLLFHRVSRAAYNGTFADYAFSWLARRNYAANYGLKCLLLSTRTPRLSAIRDLASTPNTPVRVNFRSAQNDRFSRRRYELLRKKRKRRGEAPFFSPRIAAGIQSIVQGSGTIGAGEKGPVKEERFNPPAVEGEGRGASKRHAKRYFKRDPIVRPR